MDGHMAIKTHVAEEYLKLEEMTAIFYVQKIKFERRKQSKVIGYSIIIYLLAEPSVILGPR